MGVASFQSVEGIRLDHSVRASGCAEMADEFTALVHRQSRFVFRVAFAILRNAQDAEDVVQETFIKLYRTGAWKSMEDEKAFLARVAWRIAVDRRLARNKNLEVPQHAARVQISPEAQAIEMDRTAMVHAFVDALPEELRQPLALSTVQELTSGAIATVMGIPEGTVRSRLARARQILREKIERSEGVRHVK